MLQAGLLGTVKGIVISAWLVHNHLPRLARALSFDTRMPFTHRSLRFLRGVGYKSV